MPVCELRMYIAADLVFGVEHVQHSNLELFAGVARSVALGHFDRCNVVGAWVDVLL